VILEDTDGDGRFDERTVFWDEAKRLTSVEVGFGGVADKAAVLATVRSRGCVVKSYSVTDLALHRLSADTALLTYHAAQDTVCGSVPVPSPVWVASLYVRRGGRWLNAVYQQSQETRP